MSFATNFLLYIILLLILFFQNNTKTQIPKYLIYLIIILILLLIIHPYWLYGESSAIGWYDEIDLQIFNFLILSEMSEKNIQDQFSYFLSGGTNILETMYLTKINYFFVLNIVKFFPEYIAFSLYRFLSIFFFFIGFSFFLIKTELVKNNDYFTLIFFTLLSIFSMPYEYGWAFGGTGFIYASTIWLLNLVLFTSNKNQSFSLLLFAIVISILGVSPIYFFPCSLSLLTIYFFYKKKTPNFFILFNLLLFYFFYFLLNFDLFNSLKSFDARFIEVSTDMLSQSLNTVKKILIFFSQGLDIFKNENFKTGNLFPLSFFINFFIFSFLIISSIVIKNYREAIIVVSYILFIFIFQVFINFLPSELSIIKSYTYSYIYIFTYTFVIIVLASYLKKFENDLKFQNIIKFYKIFLTLILVYGICLMNERSTNSIKTFGSWQTAKSPEIRNFLTKKFPNQNFRIISFNNRPKSSFIYYNQISTFDGSRFNHEKSKSLFFKKLTNDHSKSKSDVRHIVKKLETLDFKLLSIAGVKVILSQKQLDSLKLKFLGKVNLINGNAFITCYIYKIKEEPWDLVFAPKNIIKIKSFEDENFFTQIKKSYKNSIFIEKNDFENFTQFSKGNLNIKSINIKKNIIELMTNRATGVLVINYTTNKKLNFSCDEKKEFFNSIKANSIMRAIDINKSCKKITITPN